MVNPIPEKRPTLPTICDLAFKERHNLLKEDYDQYLEELSAFHTRILDHEAEAKRIDAEKTQMKERELSLLIRENLEELSALHARILVHEAESKRINAEKYRLKERELSLLIRKNT
jgi:hypothetical protein